jgi:hypothetical protein
MNYDREFIWRTCGSKTGLGSAAAAVHYDTPGKEGDAPIHSAMQERQPLTEATDPDARRRGFPPFAGNNALRRMGHPFSWCFMPYRSKRNHHNLHTPDCEDVIQEQKPPAGG